MKRAASEVPVAHTESRRPPPVRPTPRVRPAHTSLLAPQCLSRVGARQVEAAAAAEGGAQDSVLHQGAQLAKGKTNQGKGRGGGSARGKGRGKAPKRQKVRRRREGDDIGERMKTYEKEVHLRAGPGKAGPLAAEGVPPTPVPLRGPVRRWRRRT